jgi:hypothetical protein
MWPRLITRVCLIFHTNENTRQSHISLSKMMAVDDGYRRLAPVASVSLKNDHPASNSTDWKFGVQWDPGLRSAFVNSQLVLLLYMRMLNYLSPVPGVLRSLQKAFDETYNLCNEILDKHSKDWETAKGRPEERRKEKNDHPASNTTDGKFGVQCPRDHEH